MTGDVVVVGGGPAGISTALHLVHRAPALAGRIVVLEKGVYPRDKYCAGAVGGRALKLLERIGVRLRVPSVPIHALSLRLAGGERIVRETDMGRVVRRIEFDHALASEAKRRGVDVRDGVAVESVSSTPDAVIVRMAGGSELRALALVGADGVTGATRRSMGLDRGRLRAQVVEVDTETVEGDPPRDTLRFDFGLRDLNGYAWDFPTLVGGRELVCRGIYRILGTDAGAHENGGERRESGEAGRDAARSRPRSALDWLTEYLAAKGLAADRYTLKPFAECGFDPREPISRARILLVGEAAGIDIATGEGIAQAIQYGAVAGDYLAEAIARRDFSFTDWLDRIRASQVGYELRQRYWFYRRFYGADRDVMERLVHGAPAGLTLGARQFAGHPLGAGPLARVVAEGAFAAARLGSSRVSKRVLRALSPRPA